MKHTELYRRYHIETKKADHIVPHPYRFKVKVNRARLAKLLFTELLHYRGRLNVVASRPCVYGVFSGPVGGFAPREHLCVGCLRCTVQYPDMVQVSHNPARSQVGDDYFLSDYVSTVVYEAATGRVPVKGAGYRGPFGGVNWDGMWTDMSEIVRPTRDGIHGREYISTEIDIGGKSLFVELNENNQLSKPIPLSVKVPLPILFDQLPLMGENERLCQIVSQTAAEIHSFAILPIDSILQFALRGDHLIPLVSRANLPLLEDLKFEPLMIEMSEWDLQLYEEIKLHFPGALLILRTGFENDSIMEAFQAGVHTFHLTADYHGQGKNGDFVLDLIRKAHLDFVNIGCRDQVTLIGSGGIVAAEHVPKAIICGLDAVALDTPILAALQARFNGNCTSFQTSNFKLPDELPIEWGIQRLKNLSCSWRDQLLEISSAMGLREVRRLRGEMGRAMFQTDLENDAFAGILGYEQK